MNDDRKAIEDLIRTAFDAQAYESAATLVITHYGPELLGFLVSYMRDADDASEVFSRFSEVFWRTWPRFEWRCSARTWAYKLARNAASEHRKHNLRHQREQPLSQLSQLGQAVERVRTATSGYRRTDVKDRFQALREQLSEEDQTLLILRVDRDLSWLDLAEVTRGGEHGASAEELKTEAARLRKRFQSVKEQLRTLAEAAGLLGE